jgi:hypothetical protein
LSDWDGFSDTQSFNSVSDAFTDNHTDSDPGELDTTWFQLLKNGQQTELDRDINDVVIDIFKKGIKGEEHVS